MEPLARLSGGPVEGIFRHGGGGREPGLAFDFNMAPSSGVSFDLFAVSPVCAVSARGELKGLAFDFTVAPSSGVSFDLFAVPPLCAVAACGGLTTAALAGLRADADPGPGVGAVAATGVAGVSAPAEPSVDAVPAAGVAGGPTDSEPSVDAVAAADAAGAVEAAGVARVAAEADAAPSLLISSTFHSISCAVKGRLALSCRLPYCSSSPPCQEGWSWTISCSTSSLRCFSMTQPRRCCACCAVQWSPKAVAAEIVDWQSVIW